MKRDQKNGNGIGLWRKVAVFLLLLISLCPLQKVLLATPQGQSDSPSSNAAAISTRYASSRPGECSYCVVESINSPIVPAQESGILIDLLTPTSEESWREPVLDESGRALGYSVVPGMTVEKNQVIGRIDGRLAEVELTIAEQKLEVAKIEAARNVNGEYAQAAFAVADHQLARVQETETSSIGAISHFEIQRYALEQKRASLQVVQADQEYRVVEHMVSVREAELEKARLMLERRTIVSPINESSGFCSWFAFFSV